jgi:hypothetical protein
METDKRRTVSFSLFWPARVWTAAATVLSTAVAVVVVVTDWRTLLRPFGWWSLLISLGTGVGAFGLLWLSNVLSDYWRAFRYFDFTAEDKDTGHFISLVEQPLVRVPAFFLGPISYMVAVSPLLAHSLWLVYFPVALLGPVVLFWMPLMDVCSRKTRYSPYRPNPYVDMYEDPLSRHWLIPASSTASVPSEPPSYATANR